MNHYPDLLRPDSSEVILLPSGNKMEVPKATPTFDGWAGKPVEDTYRGKPVLDFAGEPVFAELAILRAFQNSGWDGVWVDTFQKKYRIGYWGKNSGIVLPSEQELLLNHIYERARSRSGCWDVFCWRSEVQLFIEAKRHGHDQIRATQRRWLEAAISEGLPASAFLVVEWSLREEEQDMPTTEAKIVLLDRNS